MTRRPITRLAVLVLAPALAASAGATAPRPPEFPAPELPVTVAPLPLGIAPPLVEPPAPPPASVPGADPGTPPLPRFQSGLTKPAPAMRDPGGTACTFAFGRPGALADCGVHRLLEGDLRGAREALEDSLAKDPRGSHAAAASLWLGEVAFLEGRHDEAERRYRAALATGLPGDLVPHAALGSGWLALRRGDLAGAQRGFAQAQTEESAPFVALVARFLDGVVHLLAGRAAEALAAWDAVAAGGPPVELATELAFWRGVAQTRLGPPDSARQLLERFLAAAPSTHPLYVDAIAQSAWAALARGAPEDAERRFLWAERSRPRPDLRAHIRAGQVRAYLALRDPARARDAARLLAQDSPRDALLPSALLLLADDAARRDATAEAVDLYRQLLALPLDPGLQEYGIYRFAESLERQGRTAEAEGYYQKLRDGGRVEAVAQRAAYRLGLVALRGQKPAAARAEGEALLRAAVLPELREATLLLAGEGAARADDPNRAVALFRLALRDYPGSPRAAQTRLALGWALYKDGEPETALREWQEVTLAADVDAAAHAYLAIAEVALRQGRESQAFEALRDLGRLAPSHPQAELITLNRGVLLVRAQAYTAAVQELEPLAPRVNVPARQALLRRALGIARYHLGEYAVAERQFQQAAYWAPAEPSSWLGAGLAALAQNRLTEAEEALNRARLTAVPEVAVPAAYALVLVPVRRGDRDGFRERATAFVDRHPTHPYAGVLLYGLAAAALERGDLEQADGWVKRLVRDQPQGEYVRDALLRIVDAARQRPAIAREAYRELVTRFPKDEGHGDAQLGLAEAAVALRDGADAQQALDAFLAQMAPDDPRGPRAYALLVRAHELQGQRDGTLTATEAFLTRFPAHPLAPAVQLTRGHLLLAEQRWEDAQQALELARDTGEPEVAAAAHVWLGELHRSRNEHEVAIAAYLGATYLYPDTSWAARGLQGAAQSYVSRQMRREASILLRKLATRAGVDPALAQWARQALAQLGPITGEDPAQALRKGPAKR